MLDPAKTKSIEIVLGKLKLPNSLICKALLSCDTKVLTPTIVEALDGICPAEEDVKLLK